MRIAHGLTLFASLLVVSHSALSADGDAQGETTKYPRTLTAAELRHLYGDRPVVIAFTIAKGSIRYEVKPDGRLFGHNDSLIGSAAAGAGSSDGKWRIDEAAAAVCHEWTKHLWQNNCSPVVETARGAYAWSARGGAGGLKFTVKPE